MEPVAETGLVLKENRNAGTLRFRHWVGGLFLISYFLVSDWQSLCIQLTLFDFLLFFLSLWLFHSSSLPFLSSSLSTSSLYIHSDLIRLKKKGFKENVAHFSFVPLLWLLFCTRASRNENGVKWFRNARRRESSRTERWNGMTSTMKKKKKK